MAEKQSKMFACKYGNEPIDLKLMLIYFIKRIRYVIYFTIFGALAFACIYYLKTFVLVEEHQYVATGELYLTYAEDVRLDNVYINDYTWQQLAHTDIVIETAMTQIDSNVTEDYLKQVVVAGLESDVRLVVLKVTTNDPDLSVEIAQAFQDAIIELGVQMADIDAITIFTEADSAEEIRSDNRTMKMAVTGGIVGGIATILWILLQYTFDDSIYVAGQFERRYGIPVIGICLKYRDNNKMAGGYVSTKRKTDSGRIWGQQAIKWNYRKLSGTCKKIAVTDLSMRGKTEIAMEILQDTKLKLEQDEILEIAMGKRKESEAFFSDSDYEIKETAPINVNADAVLECAQADGVIVMVQAGMHNGKLIERALDLLYKQGCNVVGALIYDGNASLLKMYYFEPLLYLKRADNEEEIEEDEQVDLDKLSDLF